MCGETQELEIGVIGVARSVREARRQESAGGSRRLVEAHKLGGRGAATARSRRCHRNRGEPMAPLAGARTAEAIVRAIEPHGCYPGVARPEAQT